MGARRARPRPGHPRPRPRPLPTSPPFPQGWGRPLPGPRGRPGFPREGTDRSTPLCQDRKARFTGNLSGRRESVGAGLGKRTVQMEVGARKVGGRRQVPGEFCVGEKGKRQESPPSPLSQPFAPSSFPPPPSSLVRAAGPGWLPSHQVSLPPAGGQT